MVDEKINASVSKAAVAVCFAVSVLFGGLFGCWLRILDVMAGRTLFTLAVCVGVGVAGVIVGAALALVGGQAKNHAVFFCVIILAAAGYHLFLMNAVNGMAASWQNMLLDTSRHFNLYFKILFKSAVIFILFFAMLAGAAATRALRAKDVGRALSWGIPGGLAFLAGCWFFGSFMIAAFGTGTTLRLMPALLGFFAAAALAAGGRRKLYIAVVVVVTAGAYFHIASLDVDMILSKGVFGRLVYRDCGFAFGDPVEERNTARHTMSVYEDRDYHFVFEMDNRPVMFGSRYHSARTLNAYVPMLIKPASEKVLLVGAEAGLFAPFLLRAGVAQLKYCQAERQVVKGVFEQDARLSSGNERGFDSLQAGGFSEKYDLIIFSPEPAYMRGAARFFSARTLRKSAMALVEDGAVALHLDARALSRAGFATILGETRKVFPHMQVWCTGVNEWVFVGAAEPLAVRAEKVLALFEKDAVFKDFVRAGGLSVADAAVCMVCDERGVDQWLARNDKRIALCEISWGAPARVFAGANALMSPALFEKARQLSATDWFLRGDLDGGAHTALVDKIEKNITARLSAVMAVAAMAGDKPDEGLRFAREAAAVNPRDALLVQFAETLELEGRRRISIGDYKGAVRCYENILSFCQDSPQAHYGIGYCLRANGDVENAYIHFARAVVGAPEQAHYRLEFAESALNAGQFETADKQYESVLKRNPEDARSMLLYAKALVREEREERNHAKAIQLAKRACELTEWRVPEAIMGLADMYIEAGRIMEGMGLKRRLKEGGAIRIKSR